MTCVAAENLRTPGNVNILIRSASRTILSGNALLEFNSLMKNKTPSLTTNTQTFSSPLAPHHCSFAFFNDLLSGIFTNKIHFKHWRSTYKKSYYEPSCCKCLNICTESKLGRAVKLFCPLRCARAPHCFPELQQSVLLFRARAGHSAHQIITADEAFGNWLNFNLLNITLVCNPCMFSWVMKSKALRGLDDLKERN